ncbi:hypothetical protein [Staphylococcus ratti]|uniref:Lipoprotein n=1 Tax=Staphylococcus ratti TaxID=2892440 RepID=A0ABY3PBT4_9STAP|nr:hypothetical protein [Staphylococcus ratti]UEX89728.1 hypothetical protein LN051_09175 [Staphylococcus ratti]
MKRIIFTVFLSLLVLSACGHDENKKDNKKNEVKQEQKDKKKDKKEKQTDSSASEESAPTTNDNQQSNTSNSNNTQTTKQQNHNGNTQAIQQNKVQQPRDPNEPTYQEYLNAKQLTENVQKDPQKYQGMGGGPGMGLSYPGQSYESYKKGVAEIRSQNESLQP